MRISNLLVYSHPCFVAVAPALFLWSINFGQVDYSTAFATLGTLLLFGALTLGMLYLLLGTLAKSAPAASATLLITLCFGYIFESLFMFNIILPWTWSVPISVCAILLILYVTHRTTIDLKPLNQFLSVAAFVFVLISVLQLMNEYRTQHVDLDAEKTNFAVSGDNVEQRDIYYIILDGYSSPEVIRSVFGYEGIDEFTNFLRAENFFVATESRSNYAQTRLSLPSSLNMQLLDSPRNVKKFDLMFEDHAVKDLLKARGYKYIHFGSNSFTHHNRYADENYNAGALPPYQEFIWTQSLLYPLTIFGARYISADIFERIGGFDQGQSSWERVHFQLDTLADISTENEAPVFIFAHFNPPKGSMFDPEGNVLTREEAAEMSKSELYIAQLQFINSEMQQLITSLKNTSELQPIIIIQGDHGYKFIADSKYNDPAALAEMIPESVSVSELLIDEDSYSFPIFNTYYFPDATVEGLHEAVSPVNSFRLLFNTYFDEDFDLLDDKSYVPNEANRSEFTPIDI